MDSERLNKLSLFAKKYKISSNTTHQHSNKVVKSFPKLTTDQKSYIISHSKRSEIEQLYNTIKQNKLTTILFNPFENDNDNLNLNPDVDVDLEDDTRCHAILKKNGERCTRQSKNGSKFCGIKSHNC
jgi:hypothetical protein